MGIKDSSLWAREILSFLETAKNGSINGTAEANAMKQSNLSRTLKSLEEKLKCQLLERGYNGVRLPIGTMRIRFFSDFVKFERMAVIRNFRKTNVAEDIMQYGLKYVAEKGYRQVYGMCKQELLPRWQQCGYHEIPGAERIEQNGMVLIPISLDLKENPQAIKMTSHPSLLTALEGHWHEKMQEVRKSSMMKAIFWKLKKIRQEHFNL